MPDRTSSSCLLLLCDMEITITHIQYTSAMEIRSTSKAVQNITW